MKTKAQIEQFLKKRLFATKMDFKMIQSFCLTEYRIKLHNPSEFIPDGGLTCAEFNTWIDHGIPAGEIVKWGETVGLVQNGDMKDLLICLSIDSNGVNLHPIIVPIQDVTLADESARKRIKIALSQKSLEFGNPYLVLTQKFIPEPGCLVAFQRLSDEAEGYGVCRYVAQNDEVHMYCYFYLDSEETHYDMDSILGNAKDFQFTAFGTSDYPRKVIDKRLKSVGKTWNHYLKRVEPINMRVAVGETYYYITDKMTVASDVENGKVASNKRYLCANYFRNEDDAIRILEDEMELRRNYLAEPEITPDPAKP